MNNIDRIGEYDALKRNLFYHSMNDAPVSKPKTHLSSALEAIESLQARIADLEGGQNEAVGYIGPLYTRPLSAVPDGWQAWRHKQEEVEKWRSAAESEAKLGDQARSETYRKESQKDFRKSEGQRIHIEEMKFGCLQRIADATEVMANNYSQMLAENQNLRMKLKLAESDEEYTRRQLAAQKGLVTKLRNKLAVRRSVESEQSEPIDSEGGHHD